MSEDDLVTHLDFAPVVDLLANAYEGNPHEAAAQLYEVSRYMMKVPSPTDTAAGLREMVAIVTGLAMAFDAIATI